MYKIDDFYTILFEWKTIPLSPTISAIFAEVQESIGTSAGSAVTPTQTSGKSFWERNKSQERHHRGGGHEKMHYSKRHGSGSGFKKDIPIESWETLRSFKTTKVEEPAKGIDKDMNEIRISLNKISVNNYSIQKEAIVGKIMQFQHPSPKIPVFSSRFDALDWEDDEDAVVTVDTSSPTDDANLVTVANAIFDIASSNKFFSELYAELYKELSQLFPIFKKIASDFLVRYMESLPKISYVDPNVDYDGFCTYTKENDVKKATSAFIVNLMKKGVLSTETVLDIVLQLHRILLDYIHLPGKLNEVEELAENWGILITNAKDTSLTEMAEWSQLILPAIRALSQMNPKEKDSLSNRVLFKWMNILDSL
jgi:hypothetical protein